jgi:hypothetical protein
MGIARVQNGKIVEGWNCFDFMSLYQQVGLLPAVGPVVQSATKAA